MEYSYTSKEQLQRIQKALDDFCHDYENPVKIIKIEDYYDKIGLHLIVRRPDGSFYRDTKYINSSQLKTANLIRINNALENSLGKFMKKQVNIAKKFPNQHFEITPLDFIDLSDYRIDIPILNVINKYIPEKLEYIAKRTIVDSSYYPDMGYLSEQVRSGGMRLIEISHNRSVIQGHIELSNDEHRVAWKNGSLKISNISLPESIMTSLKGKKLGSILEHEMLDPEMIISGFSITNPSSQDPTKIGMSLTFKNPTTKILANKQSSD